MKLHFLFFKKAALHMAVENNQVDIVIQLLSQERLNINLPSI